VSRPPTPERELRRLGRLLALPVVAIHRTTTPGWKRLWVVQLADGRMVALGHDRHVRDRRLLGERLTEAGAELDGPVTSGRASAVLGLLVRLHREQEERCTS
jgi:hypothetical protein